MVHNMPIISDPIHYLLKQEDSVKSDFKSPCYCYVVKINDFIKCVQVYCAASYIARLAGS